jgi:hypothetical protein
MNIDGTLEGDNQNSNEQDLQVVRTFTTWLL